MIGRIFDIKEFAVHDGPGLRMTVFLKGCPLRCIWCHNPEGLHPEPQLMIRKNACTNCGLCRSSCSHPECQIFGRCLHICPKGAISVVGEDISPQALAVRIRRNLRMFETGGGVTFSGGEPLLQAEFIHAVMDQLPDVSFAIETSGYASEEIFERIIHRMQTVFMDLKLADDTAHQKFTGVSNKSILRNLEILRASGVNTVIRTPLIPNITDTNENITSIKAIIGDLPHELLPYNALAGAKYELLNMTFPFSERI